MSNKSTNVETNVVQMRFDNKNFEKNVKDTINSVDKLKKELKFEDSAKSFKTLEENAKKVNLSPLSKGIEKVRASFSFLDTFSATVYHRLSNRLIDLGKKVVSSVSTDGIKSGFSEYELKMNSFKTIKASAGKDFTDSKINEYLEELNEYADKTIYSFSDMTNNIGKFTNAGVKLDVAVKAIKGISNEAAVSGANAAEASRAMYNFSQALSSGYVKLIDWKSIENANMATEEFKNELIKTAASVGTLTKAQNGMYKTQKGKLLNSTRGFNDALQDQWMTTEVLTKTLERYADKTTDIGKKAFDAAQKVNTFSKLMDTLKESLQSGWSRVWELVVGDLEQATALWTSISNAVGKFIDKRFGPLIKMLDDWNKQHGRADTLRAIKDILKSIGELLKPIGRAFRDIFPKKTVNDLLAFTAGLENFAKKVKPTSEQAKKLQDTFRGIFAAIDILRMAISAFKKTFGGVFVKILGDALHTIFGVTGSLGDMLTAVRKNIKENDTFNKVLKPIANTLLWVYGIIKKVSSVLWNFAGTVKEVLTENGGVKAFGEWFKGLREAISNFSLSGIATSIGRFFKGLWKTIDGIISKTFNFYTPFKNKLKEAKDKIVNSKFGQWIVGFYRGIVDAVQDVFNSFRDVKTDGIDDMNNNAEKKVGIFGKIINFFKKSWEVIKSIALTIWPYIRDVVKSIGTGIQMLISGVTENIRKSDMGDAGGLLGGAGIFAIGLGIRSFVKGLKPMFDAASAFGKGAKALKNIFNLINEATKLIKAQILKSIAVSILMLSASLLVLSTIPKEKLVTTTLAIATLMQGMTAVFKAIDSANGLDVGIVDEKGKTSGAGRLFGVAATLTAMALAVSIMVVAIKALSKVSVEDITKGAIVITVLFASLSSAVSSMLQVGKFTKTMGGVDIKTRGVASVVKSFGKALLLIMVSFWILSKIAKNFNDDNETLSKLYFWLLTLIGLIGGIMVLMAKFSKEKKVASFSANIKTSFGMIGLAVALQQFAIALVAILAAIAIIAIVVNKKGMTGKDLSEVVGAMVGAVTTMILAMLAMVGLAKLTKPGDVVRIMGLLAGISVFILAVSHVLLILSFLPSDWAMTGTSALAGIALSISMIAAALGYFMKQVNRRANNKIQTKALVKILGTITLSVLALAAAVAGIAIAIHGNNVWAIIGVLMAIAGCISAITLALGKFETFGKGFDRFTKGLAAIGIAAAGFAAAAALIIYTLKKVSKMSDSEIDQIGKNMQKVATAILSSSDQFVGMIMGLIRNVVKTVIDTAIFTILDSAETIIEGLIDLCDKLLLKAPVLVNKVLELIIVVLVELEKKMAPVVAQIVSFVIAFISDVAAAIKENAPKIISAIDDILDAISTLVAQGIAKIFSFDQFEGAVNTLKKIVKPVSALLIGMFAYKKIKDGSNAIITILKKLGTKINGFKSTLKGQGFKSAWNEFFGIDKLNDSFKKATEQTEDAKQTIIGDVKAMKGHVLSSMGSLAKGLLTGAGIGVAIGSVAKAFIDAKTDAIDATTSWAEDTDSELKELRDTVEKTADELREARKKNKEDIKEVNKEYDTQETMLERLSKLYDPKTGKVLEGHEDEVKSIAEKINTALGVRLELEGKLLNIIDEQGKKRKVDLDYLKELNERERLKATLDKNKELIESYKGEGGLLQLQRTQKSKAEKKKTEYEELLKFVEDNLSPGASVSALEKKAEKDEDIKQKLEKIKELYGDTLYDVYHDTISGKNWKEMKNDLRSNISTQETYIKKAEGYIKQMEYEIQRYEEGVNAALSGMAEQIHNVNIKYLSGYVAKGAGTEFDMTTALKKQMDMLKNMSLNPGDYDKTQMKQYLEGMLKQMTDLGYNKDTKIEGGYKIALRNQFGALENINFDTYGDLYAYYLEAFGRMPELMSEEIANGVEAMGKDSKIKSAVDSFSDSLKEGTTSSFKDGLSSNAKSILSNFVSNKDNTNGILGFLRSDTDTHSPSGLYAEKIGKPLGEGILVGMEEAIESYDSSVLANTLVSKLQSSIFPAIASLTGNSSLFGGITPVNFGMNQNGSGYSNMTNLPATSFASPLPYQPQLDLINTNLNKILEATHTHTETMVTEIRTLRGDVNGLASHIDDLELRLDGDAVVGGLTPKINDSLLRYARRIERGL